MIEFPWKCSWFLSYFGVIVGECLGFVDSCYSCGFSCWRDLIPVRVVFLICQEYQLNLARWLEVSARLYVWRCWKLLSLLALSECFLSSVLESAYVCGWVFSSEKNHVFFFSFYCRYKFWLDPKSFCVNFRNCNRELKKQAVCVKMFE